MPNSRAGVVIFTGDHERLAKFYEGVTELPITFADETINVLASEAFELMIHSLPSEPAVSEPAMPRVDVYVKPFFPVASLSDRA